MRTSPKSERRVNWYTSSFLCWSCWYHTKSERRVSHKSTSFNYTIFVWVKCMLAECGGWKIRKRRKREAPKAPLSLKCWLQSSCNCLVHEEESSYKHNGRIKPWKKRATFSKSHVFLHNLWSSMCHSVEQGELYLVFVSHYFICYTYEWTGLLLWSNSNFFSDFFFR